MRKKLLLFLSLFFAASVSAQMSGTYTISGDASQNPDYQTINAAATAVASQGVNGDVTFEIAPGTYSEYVTLNSIAGVSDDARVTFKGMGADNTGVVITSNAGYTTNYTLKLDGADYVTFENMTMQSTSENTAVVVSLQNGNEYDVFKNVRFIGCVWESSSTDNNKNVVYRASGSWLDVNNSFIDCDFVNGCVGLYYQGYNTTQYNDGLVVENCTFTNQSMKGVYVTFTDHVTVNGCTINNLTNDLKSDYNAIDVANCRYNCVFENNVMNVTRNNTYATVFKIRSGIGTEEAPVIVRNNIINLETSVSSNSYTLSIDQNATDWVYILHNTFNIKGSGVGSNFFLQKNITNVFVYNNLFVNETSGYVLRFANNITGRECDYNRVSFAGENVGLQAGTDYATLADWNTATGYDANTTTCTPNFVSATNLHLADTTGSVLVPHVCALAPTDIDGENRSATTPCAGADELGATIPMGDTYSITIADTENGEVEASADVAEEGTVIVLNVTPDAGYELFSLTYVYGDNDPIDITTAKSFTMPAADVTVNATFKHAPVETLIAHFEDLEIDSDGFWKPTEDEQDDMGYAYMQSQGWAFQNYYYDYYGWTGTMGFTASNCSDTTLTGLDAQYTAVTGKGRKSTNYAMCYPMGNTTVAAVDGYPRTVTGCYITNDLWTYQAILEGDGYGPAFGGEDGTEPDYLKIIATGLDEEGEEIGTTEFYLADYRFENSEEDYVVTDWCWFDLSVLGEVSAIRFDIVGSRNNDYGLTTPGYFCMDDYNGEAPAEPVETLIAHFEDLEIDSDGFWKPTEDEQDDMGYAYMQSQGWAFQNYYYDYYGWTGTMGFTASNCSDTTLTGLDAQYTAVTGKGHKSTNYAMCYPMGNTTVAAVDGYPRTVTGCYITNDLWTYQAILEGDGYGPAFGGNDGTEPDYLKIIATGLDEEGEEIGTTEFYLADYRFENSEEDYVVTDWRWFDLSVLGEVSAIRFDLAGSRNNDYGLTTPGYFCMDDYNGEAPAEPVETLIAHFEDVELNADGIWQAETLDENTYFYSQGWKFSAFTSEYYWSSFTVSNSTNTELTGYAGQYTATTGKGVNGSDNYAVAYVYNTEVSAIDGYPRTVTGCYVTNDMYTYTSLMEGDYYSGGPFETGDYLVLYAIGLDEEGEEISNTEFYLADYRSSNEAEHYIVTDWKWFDLSVLGEVSKVRFEMDGSRTGDWGLNTPAYFCMDDFNGVEPVEPVCEAVQPLNLAAALDGNDVNLTWDYTPAGATVYDFEGATEEEGEQGWTTIDADGDGYDWYWLGYGVNQTTGVMCHEGIGGWTSASYQGSALNPDNYLVSPQVTVTGSNNTFKFWANAQDASWAAEHFGVAISTTGNTSAADFTTIQEWDMTAKASGTWYEFTIDLSDYMGQAIYVAIRHFNCSDMFRINVDDVTFTGAGGDGTAFNIYRSLDGENYELIDTVEELSYTDEDLDYGTYYYQVTSVSALSDGTECESDPALAANGQDDFVMVELIEPTYECVTPINLDATANGGSAILTWEMPGGATYEYDFEGGLSGWTTFEGAGAESTWVHSDNNAGGYDYTEHAHSGTGFAVSYSFVDYVGEYQADNYLVSPVKYSIANGTTMTFFYDFANESYADFFAVEISTGSNNTAADFTEVWSSDAKKVNGSNAIVRKVNGTRYDNWQEATIDLSAYAGQEVWIAFHHEDYDMYEIWIDDVTVGAGASAPLFNIYRSTDGVTYELIAEGVEEMSYTDNGLGDGTYYYQVTSVQYGLDGEVACESDPALSVNGEDDFVMVVIDGINENETAINVYPNPSNGVVNVKVDGYEMFTYTVYNSIGQIVMTGTSADAVTTIDLGTYGSGMYLLNVNLNGDVTTKKIFIK